MKILVIGAHQDDNELRVGGIAFKWVEVGHTVRFLSLSDGSGGHHIMNAKETRERRAKESAAVAEYMGIEYDIWDIEDCRIVADLPTRERLIRYIREFSPDLIVAHRPNDYHADHRAAGQLVMDASYILTVPNACSDVPAMRFMPTIVYNEDNFKNPEFSPTYVVSIDDVIDKKLHIVHLNESQVYEWLPYTHGEVAPDDAEGRKSFLKGMEITSETTDEEIMGAVNNFGYAVRFAKPAAKFRRLLVEKYGTEKGAKVRYAEAFELCEYGRKPDEAFVKAIFGF